MPKVKKPQATRLNNEIREHVLEQVADTFDKREAKVAKKMDVIGLKLFMAHIGTPAERKLMNELPRGWMDTTSYFYIDVPAYSPEVFSISKKKVESSCEYRRYYRHKLKELVRKPYEKSTTALPNEAYTKLHYEIKDLREEKCKTLLELWCNLKEYKTVEELVSDWPEGKKYIKSYIPVTTTAVAVRFDDINKAIKGGKNA